MVWNSLYMSNWICDISILWRRLLLQDQDLALNVFCIQKLVDQCNVMEENLQFNFSQVSKTRSIKCSWLVLRLNSSWLSDVETLLLVLRIVWRDARCTATIRRRIFLTPVQRSRLFIRSWTAVWAVVWTTTLTWSPAWPADSRRIWTLYSSKGQFGRAKSVFETAWMSRWTNSSLRNSGLEPQKSVKFKDFSV